MSLEQYIGHQVLPLASCGWVDSGITQLKAQGPSRTCNESKEEEEEYLGSRGTYGCEVVRLPHLNLLGRRDLVGPGASPLQY